MAFLVLQGSIKKWTKRAYGLSLLIGQQSIGFDERIEVCLLYAICGSHIKSDRLEVHRPTGEARKRW